MFFSKPSLLSGPSTLSKRAAFWMLVGIGSVLAGVLLVDVYADWAHQEDPLWSTVLENLVPAVLALMLPYAGWRLLRQGPGSPHLPEAAKWTVLGCAGMILLSGLVMGIHVRQGEIKPVVIVLQLATVGAIAGLWVGTSVAQVKEAEQKTQKERDRLANLLEGLPAPLVHGRVEGNRLTVLRANAAFKEVFGHETDEVEGRNLYDIVVPEEKRQEAAEIEQQAIEGELVETEVRRETADGPRDFQLRVTQALDDGASETYAIYTDITEQKRRERALAESEARYRSIAESAQDAIVTIDANSTIQFANPAVEDIFGYDPAELIGESLTMLMPEEFREAHLDAVDQFLETGEQHMDWSAVEFPGLRKNGEEIKLSISFSEYEMWGAAHFEGIIRDVTDRKERQQELIEAKEEAEEASQLKSAMLANMSHEIRTPLTSITGFSEMLKSKLKGDLEVFANRIHRSSQRLQRTLESVLHLSKLEAGVHELPLEDVSLGAVAKQVVETLAQGDGPELRLKTPRSPVVDLWNEDAVYRICRNLVENAVKFTPKEGQVEVHVWEDEETGVLKVEDSGIGMDPERVPELFKAFKQGSEGLDREYEGSGLGLSIVQKLTGILGGTIDVETEKGVGSCFTVRLPPPPKPPNRHNSAAE